jgi:hypothetical protein
MILNDTSGVQPPELSPRADQVLTAIAESLGLLVTPEEAVALDLLVEKAGDTLYEASSVVRLNRQAKLDSLITRSALTIAQQKNDPLFQKYARAAGIKRQLRGIIMKKYSSQAQMTARRLLASAGKKNLVDISGAAVMNREHRPEGMHATAGEPPATHHPTMAGGGTRPPGAEHAGERAGRPGISR